MKEWLLDTLTAHSHLHPVLDWPKAPAFCQHRLCLYQDFLQWPGPTSPILLLPPPNPKHPGIIYIIYERPNTLPCTHSPPMHRPMDPACLPTKTPIRPQLDNTEGNYMILLLLFSRFPISVRNSCFSTTMTCTAQNWVSWPGLRFTKLTFTVKKCLSTTKIEWCQVYTTKKVH